MNVEELFEKHEDEFLNYEGDPDLSNLVRDVYIFNKLEPFVKGGYLIGSAPYDEMYFTVNTREVTNTLSEEEMIKLIRCDLRHSSDHECFVMFI